MTKEFKLGDVVYLLLSPNNYIRGYRYTKCVIYKIYDRWGNKHFESITVTDDNCNNIRFGLADINDTKYTYCNKTVSKLYTLDELEELELDVNNLNAVLCFKQQQKNELLEYISKNFSNWKFRGNINL